MPPVTQIHRRCLTWMTFWLETRTKHLTQQSRQWLMLGTDLMPL